MSSIFQKIKMPLIVLILIIIIFYGYSLLSKKGIDTKNLISDTSSNPTTSQADQDFLNTLSKVQGIKIDTSIFSDQAFNSLTDDSQPIVPGQPGRTNPFAPIGVDSGSFSTTSAGTASTTDTGN